MPDPTQMTGLQWIATVVVGLILLGLQSYVAVKAKNAATHKDLDKLTRVVEDIKASYARDLERLKSALLKDVESHRIRYETELDTYRKIWPAAQKLLLTASAVEMPSLQSGPEQMKVLADSRRAYHQAHQAYEEALMELRPFYPDEVYKELLALGSAVAGMIPPSITDAAWYAKVMAEREKLRGLVDGICDTIRKRLHAASLEVDQKDDSAG